MEHIWSPWRMAYIQSNKNETSCVFCLALTKPDDTNNLIVVRSQNSFVILNRYPYTTGHIMVVPYTHVPTLDGLDPRTRAELMDLAMQATSVLGKVYQPEGFNLGINIGKAAGAGITEHVHLHVVPRWMGDTNFMSTLGNTRVLPETLEESYQRIHAAWHNIE